MSRDILTRAFRNITPQPGMSRVTLPNNAQGVAPSQDMAAQMGSMSSVSTLFAVVDRLASSTAAVGWKLYKKNPRVDPDARDIVERHPALVVWNNPNPFYSQRLLVESITQHYDLTGEWWLWQVRAPNGMPMELWPIRPDLMRPVPHPTEHLAGYVFKGKQDVPLGVGDVLTMRRPNPLNAYRGISPIGSLIFDLSGERAASQWNANFFTNSARPDGVLQAPQELSDQEYERLKLSWRENHQGAANAHRTAILEAGVTFQAMGYSQKEMDFTALRRFSKEQIMEAYGFPPFMLGHTDGLARANATASERMFAKQSTVPRLDLIREMLNTRLLPQFPGSEQVEFDYDNPVPPDAEEDRKDLRTRSDVALGFIGAGFDDTEVLEAFGLPPLTRVREPAAASPGPGSIPGGVEEDEPEEPEE